MSNKYPEYFARAKEIEGLVSNHVSDSGGLTICGIAQNSWPNEPVWGWFKEHGKGLLTLPMFQAYIQEFYKVNFWDKIQGDNIGDALAWELFEFGINAGPGVAVMCLQRILNAHNKRQALWPDLLVTGFFGPLTLAAYRSMLSHGYTDEDLAVMVNALQFSHYINLTQRSESQEDFMNGWTKKRVLEKA